MANKAWDQNVTSMYTLIATTVLSCLQHWIALPPKTNSANCSTLAVYNSFLWLLEHFSNFSWATRERCIHKTESTHSWGSDGLFVRSITVWRENVYWNPNPKATKEPKWKRRASFDSVENAFIFFATGIFSAFRIRRLVLLCVGSSFCQLPCLSPNSAWA